ncbi:lysostaphin resistance A-like protein [Thermophagus sp. OGC60D27]|uniref:lysostaphin resistance A-like protein n=1 Tax=Thermophagus sp. OGC60D27 TaxID=3458415 RepID=UPI004037EF10
MKAIWNHLGGFGKLVMAILLVVTSFMVFSFLAMLLALPFVEGFSFFDTGSIDGLLTTGLLRYFQIVQSISLFIIPSLLASFLFWGHYTRGIGLWRPNGRMVALSFLIIVLSQPAVNYLGLWNSSLQLPESLSGIERWMHQSEESAVDLIYQFLNTDHLGLLLVNVLMIAVLPALGEEMLFRGVLQPIFREWFRNAHVAVFVTAFLFSAIHLQFYTFLPRFFLGLALGYLMIWGENLWYPIVGHFANNFLSLILFYYYRYSNPEINPLQPSPDELSIPWLFSVPAIVGMIFFFWQFYKSSTLMRSSQF